MPNHLVCLTAHWRKPPGERRSPIFVLVLRAAVLPSSKKDLTFSSLRPDVPSIVNAREAESSPGVMKELRDPPQIDGIAAENQPIVHHLQRQSIGPADHLLKLV